MSELIRDFIQAAMLTAWSILMLYHGWQLGIDHLKEKEEPHD
jgi:hypothetical protein